jgi:hypothetical protein
MLGITTTEIDQIKNMPAYQETFEILFKELLSVNSTSLQARIASYAGRAIDNVMDLAEEKKVEQDLYDASGDKVVGVGEYLIPPIVKLKANQDILDRSGMAAEQLFGNQDQDQNTLEIVVTSKKDQQTDVKINIGRKG